jgi:hypothetical protein
MCRICPASEYSELRGVLEKHRDFRLLRIRIARRPASAIPMTASRIGAELAGLLNRA